MHTFVKNGHGDVTALYNGTTSAETYIYDGFGNIRNTPTFDNPIRYSGEYFDEETGFIYLRARYYAPDLGRFTAEDTHWNTSNMIYGDKVYKEDETRFPDINAINQNANLHIYCMNNPIKYIDLTGNSVSGIGLSASAAAVLGLEGQMLWVTDDKGNFAVMLVGGGISSVGLSLSGVIFTFPDMPNLYKMSGKGFGINMSIGSYGGGVLTSGEYVGVSASAGIGADVDVLLSPDVTYTYITPIKGNVNSVGEWLKKTINIFLPKEWEI